MRKYGYEEKKQYVLHYFYSGRNVTGFLWPFFYNKSG